MTTKALSKLGFNADVFLGKYDDNKYVAKMKEEFAEPKPKLTEDELKYHLEHANKDELRQLLQDFDLTEIQKKAVIVQGKSL